MTLEMQAHRVDLKRHHRALLLSNAVDFENAVATSEALSTFPSEVVKPIPDIDIELLIAHVNDEIARSQPQVRASV